MYLFGSQAMNYWFPDSPFEPKDTDYICKQKPDYKLKDTEFFTFEYCKAYEIIQVLNEGLVLEPDILYTFKLSHLPWKLNNHSWTKHLRHAIFLKEKGCKIIPELHKELQIEWEHRHGSKKQINLNKPASEFFTEKVKRFYPHDYLHEVFKIEDVPAYTLIHANGQEVLTDEHKFQSLTEYQKYCTVLEEVAVTGYERRLGFFEAYQHLVTSLSKGYWNTWALDHAGEIIKGFRQEKEVIRKTTLELLNKEKEYDTRIERD